MIQAALEALGRGATQEEGGARKEGRKGRKHEWVSGNEERGEEGSVIGGVEEELE